MPVPPSRSRRPVRRPIASLLLAMAVLSACSDGEELDVEGFAPGTCTDVAPTLQDVDEALREVSGEDLSPGEAADRFKAAQDVLKPVAGSADAPVGDAVRDLVTRMGYFRIAVDTNAYDGEQGDDVRTALDAVAQECLAG